ncbi:MAG: hypothetical protein AB1513_04665 [Pseudomonadota bacterium]
MSVWKLSYERLQASQRLRESLAYLDTVNTAALGTPDLTNLARLQKALRILDARMTSLDPELFHPTTWVNMAAWLTNLVTYTRDFGQTANVTQLQNANSTVDEMLNVLKPVDIGSPMESLKALTDATSAFQQRLVDELETLRAKVGQSETQLKALSTGVAVAGADVDALRNTIEQQKSRLDQAIAEFQRQYSQAESTRASEFASASQRFATEFAEQKKEFATAANAESEKRSSDWAGFVAKTQKSSDEFFQFFKKRQDEVNAIFGAIGSASLSGHFARTADQDAEAANLLRWIALGLMAAMIVVGGISFYQSFEHPDVDWKIFMFRFATVFVIAIPAIYAAQESSKHRRREQQNRKLQVELASIDAYLVQLPEAKQQEIKEKLTEKFFGQPDPSEKDEPVTRHQLFDLLSDVLKRLTKVN